MLLGNIIKDGFLGIILTLDSIIYSLISSSYKIFMALAGARLLSSDAYNAIANKIYIVIGVVMLFVLAYAMLKAIIDPDQAAKGDLGGPKLLKNVIVAVIGLAIAPVLFNLLYQVQGLVLENNVLGKIFFRSDNQTYDYPDLTIGNEEETVTVTLGEEANHYNDSIQTIGGAHVATTIWQAFFYPSEEGMESQIEADSSVLHATSVGLGLACAAGIAAGIAGFLGSFLTLGGSLFIAGAGAAFCWGAASKENTADKIDNLMGRTFTLEEAYIYSASEGDFWIYQGFIEPLSDDEIHYSWFLSTIVGAFVAYAFVTFSIDMGMRAAKLAYYQIIAPIPIILQILPKFKDSFNKYVKSVISTFIEVFIRITVVYVIVYIMCHLTDMFSTTAIWAGMNFAEKMLARALLMVGLVLFAKQAPKMISETFGIQNGSIDMGIRKKLAEGGAFTAGAFLGGGISTGVRNLTHAGANIKKNWGERIRKNEDYKNKSFAGKAATVASVFGGGVARGVASTIAGTASGSVRSSYAGRKAANVKDMTTAAREGIGKATLKRTEREEYREAHPALKKADLIEALDKNLEDKKGVQRWTAGVSTVVGAAGVAGGHVQDAVRSISGWAGLNNLEAIDAQIKKANELKDAKKDMKSKAEALITSKAASSKRGDLGVSKNTTFDFSLDDNKKFSMFQDKDFKNFNVETYRRITDGLEQAKQNNGMYDHISSADWEAFRGKYLSDFTDEVQNVVLQSESNYQAQMNDPSATKTNAWLTEVRAAANKFKNALAKNVGDEWVIKANKQEADVTKPHEYAKPEQQLTAAYIKGDLKVNQESALSKLDDQIDISIGKLNEARAKLREKQPEAKKNDSK